QAFSEWFIGFL
ncbi:hypothetical protein VCHENC02_2286B, partial [Vibrio harveyi]